MKKIIIFTICIIGAVLCVICSACNSVFTIFKKLTYKEFQDAEQKILLRAVWCCEGNGYVTVNNKKINLEFFITHRGQIAISVKKEDLGLSDDFEKYETAAIYFNDINKNNELVSIDDDVSIFGEYYGKIVLKGRDINRATVDASEYTLGWQTKDDDWLSLNTLEYPHLNKLLWFKIKIDGTENDYVFQWQAEKKFSIYKYNTNEDPIGEFLAWGTYENVENKATLTFVEDNLFNFKYPTLELVAEFYNEM